MRRTIFTILICITTMFTSAQPKNYPIADDFRKACRITAPLGRGMLGFGNSFLATMPKGMRSNKLLEIRKTSLYSSIDSVKIRAWVIVPKLQNAYSQPAILFIHGGGFVFRGAPYHYKLAKEYAQRTQSIVVVADYRTAHNNAYGIPLHDCQDIWLWMTSNASTLGIDTNRTAIAGDSAGGFLAIKTSLWAANYAPICPSKLMLIYPVVDCLMSTESMKQFTDTPVWNAKLNSKMWTYYLQGQEEVSILNLSDSILRLLPPTYIETAEYDCLRDEGYILATMLQNAGIETTYIATKNTMHGFDMVQRSKITQQQIAERCTWLMLQQK